MTIVPTDIELVDCAAKTYLRNDPIATTADGSLRVFSTLLPSGVVTIDNEGTHNVPGWITDFDAFNDDDPVLRAVKAFCGAGTSQHPTIEHPQLGLLHAGFDASAMEVYPAIKRAIAGRPFAIDGHSLGAAIALRLAAEFVLDGTPPLVVGAYAPPRVGGAKFVQTVMTIQRYAWKWGDDPVPEVPFTLPPLYDYKQIPLTKTGHFLVDAFDCHKISNYDAAVHAAES